MAVTFFWRCEGTTLDATHDFSAGDTSAAANATPSISATAALVGSNGILCDSAGDRYNFAPTSIIDPAEGAVAMLFRFPSAVPNDDVFFLARGSASANDNINLQITGTDEITLTIRNAASGAVTLATTAANITAGTTYGVVARWDQPNSSRRLEVYDATGTLIQAVQDLATGFTAPAALDAADGLRFGDSSGGLGTCYLDNCFVADAYAEPLEDNLLITSWTEYDDGSGGGVVSLPAILASYNRRRR
jgi:hypothetical protein